MENNLSKIWDLLTKDFVKSLNRANSNPESNEMKMTKFVKQTAADAVLRMKIINENDYNACNKVYNDMMKISDNFVANISKQFSKKSDRS